MEFDSPPEYSPHGADHEEHDTTQLPSLFDPALVHSIENEIDLDLVEEIAQDFDWVEDRFVKETRATNDILDEASLNHLLGDLGDGSDDADLEMDTRGREPHNDSCYVEHGGAPGEYYSEAKSPTLHHHDNTPELHAHNLPVVDISPAIRIEIPKENYNSDRAPSARAVTKAISPAPSPVTSAPVTPPPPPPVPPTPSPSPPPQPPTEDVIGPTSTKSARKRRMDLMLQRKLGRYHSRQRVSDRQIPPDQLKIAAKAAVAAVLDTSSPMDRDEVVNIARGLLMERVAEWNEISSPPSPVQSTTTALAVPDKTSSRPVMSQSTKQMRAEKPKKIKRATTAQRKPAKSRKLKDDGNSSHVASAPEAVELPDGDDAESRRQRRLIRNRMSAQLHRERKREAMDTLKREIEERDDELVKLRQQLEQALNHNTTLESSLNVIKNHFGNSTIDNILQQTAPPSPPHIVNNTSDSSSDSDTPSAPASPVPSTDIIPNQVMSYAGKGHKRSISDTKPRKKKKLGTGLLLMGTLSVCAFIAAVISPVRQDTHSEYMTNQGFVPMNAGDNDRNEALKWRPDSDKIYNHDMRRRLLSVTSSSGESLLEQQLNDAKDGKNYMLSPIETIPSLWKLDHASRMAPWTYRSSHSFFDLTADAAIVQRFASASLSHLSLVALSTIMSRQRQSQMDGVGATGRNDETPLTGEERAKAALKPKRVKGRRLRGTSTATTSMDSESAGKPSSLSLSSVKPALPASAPIEQTLTPAAPDKGSSFMFCPSAHASLSPQFLEWSGLGNMESIINKQDEWDLNGTSNSSRSSTKVEEDDDEDEEEYWFTEQQETPLTFETTNTDNDNTQTSAQKDQSKALVPSFSNSRKLDKMYPVMKTIMGGDDPYMTILIPASAFRGTVPIASDNAHGPTPWVELGCQVLSARLVDGVEFRTEHVDDNEERGRTEVKTDDGTFTL